MTISPPDLSDDLFWVKEVFPDLSGEPADLLDKICDMNELLGDLQDAQERGVGKSYSPREVASLVGLIESAVDLLEDAELAQEAAKGNPANEDYEEMGRAVQQFVDNPKRAWSRRAGLVGLLVGLGIDLVVDRLGGGNR